jgi:predicted phage terminase large subunit-like protein
LAETKKRGLSLPKPIAVGDWQEWLEKNFPSFVGSPMGERHVKAWEWMDSLRPGTRLPPEIFIWPRGGGKSTTVQLGCARVASKLSRRFALYVSGTQDQADRHVQTVSNLLLKLGHQPLVSKLGHQQGWRREQLRTAHGFNMAGIGLDVAVRGIKLDEFRPDWIILDDIDGREDTPLKTAKKERAITQDIIPAGSSDVCVVGFQNLIIEDGIFSRIYSGRADYLLDAVVHPPEPAVRGLVAEDDRLENGKGYKRIASGEATWEGQDLEIAQRQIIDWGWTAFKRESQHEVYGADGYFFDASRLAIASAIPDLIRYVRAWDLAGTEGGGDFTVGVLMGIAKNGVCYVLDVIRSQMSTDRVRRTVKATAEADQAHYGEVLTLIPQDPGQAGVAQVAQFRDLLAGFPFMSRPVTGKKSVRARGWADAVNDGNAFLAPGDWNHAYREEHRQFKEDETHDYDDQVDPSADAYNQLTGGNKPTVAATAIPTALSSISAYVPR